MRDISEQLGVAFRLEALAGVQKIQRRQRLRVLPFLRRNGSQRPGVRPGAARQRKVRKPVGFLRRDSRAKHIFYRRFLRLLLRAQDAIPHCARGRGIIRIHFYSS